MIVYNNYNPFPIYIVNKIKGNHEEKLRITYETLKKE